jgi:putative colanic acid biosynthesis glycosyltransferase
MKVLLINTVCGHGSTGRICTDIADVLQKRGDECFIAYGQLSTDYQNSFKIGGVLENHFHNLFSRITGRQGYFTITGTKKLIKYIQTVEPDIIHLHNLHGNYLNLEILFNYLARIDKPVIWTLHDCWAYTGKCAHYTDTGCYKWETHCHNCPQVKKYPTSLYFDRSLNMFAEKKKRFTSVRNMTIITVSQWLAMEAKRSFLAQYPIIPIYNWVDHSVFKPISKNLKPKFGFSEDKFVILVVSACWNKNDTKLNDLINLSKIIPDNMQIAMVGQMKSKNKIPANITHIPYVQDLCAMAEIYSMADVYVHLSVEDTFGKVIAEAMSCGTPAIVYNSTASPELIDKGCGFIVEKRNINAIYVAIQQIETDGKQKYSITSRRRVQRDFDYIENTGKTIQLYKSLIDK